MGDDEYIKSLNLLQKRTLAEFWEKCVKRKCANRKTEIYGMGTGINEQLLEGNSKADVIFVSTFGKVTEAPSAISGRPERGSEIFDLSQNSNNSNDNNHNNQSQQPNFPFISKNDALSRLEAGKKINIEKTTQIKALLEDRKKILKQLRDAQENMAVVMVDFERVNGDLDKICVDVREIFDYSLHTYPEYMIPSQIIRKNRYLKTEYYNAVGAFGRGGANDQSDDDSGNNDDNEEGVNIGDDLAANPANIDEGDQKEGVENEGDVDLNEGVIDNEAEDDGVEEDDDESVEQDGVIDLVQDNEDEEKKMELADSDIQSDQGAMSLSEDGNQFDNFENVNWSQQDGFIDDDVLANIKMDENGNFIW